jgi:hypothetical protein
MASYKTQVQTVTYDRVGFASIPLNYDVDGVSYFSVVALRDSNGTLIDKDIYLASQFSGLSPKTTYKLSSIYIDEYGEIVADIPDTEVEFTTKEKEYYTPVISNKTETSISIAEMSDSIWDSGKSTIMGFGIGVELCDSDGKYIKRIATTPCEFTGLSKGATYIIKSYVWSGTSTNNVFKNNISGTDVQVTLEEEKKPSVSLKSSSTYNSIDLVVSLLDFVAPSFIRVYLDNSMIVELTDSITNKEYNFQITDLDEQKTYNIEVQVLDGGVGYAAYDTVTTKAQPTDILSNEFKDFWIAVGQPGAYSKNMEYTEVFGMNARFGIKIKHAPYSPMAKIKNVVTQSWKDENGDDVWLPRAIDKDGNYIPAVTHESVDYNPVFVIFGDKEIVNSNSAIRDMLQLIEGRWLKIWDEYTQMGFEGVYLTDVDDDPKFKRRNYDYVQFTLKFKINGTNIDAPFEGVGSK